MSIYKEVYMAAAGTALAAAAMILRPWAFYVAAGLGTMVSDPEGMAEAAQGWRTDELDTLTQALDGLKTQLQEQGTWEGSAFDSFETVHTSFKNSVTALNEARNNTSDAVGSTGDFYKVGAYFCSAVALFMMGFAIWKMFMRSTPVTAAAAEAADTAVGAATTTTMKTMLKRHGIAVGTLLGLLYMLKGQTQATGKLFPSLEAIPTQATAAMDGNFTMPFMNDGLTYEEGAGALMQKPDDSMAQPDGGTYQA